MPSVTRSCGTGANVSTGFGASAWSNAGNITASDNSYATATFNGGLGGGGFDYLKATNFGFSIDSGATIDGIEVIIERKDAGGSITDSEIKILNGDGSAGIGTSNKSGGAAWPTSDASTTFGGSSDTWSETWTPAKVNSSDFGVYIRCSSGAGFGVSDTASVDHVQITVHYTVSANNPSTSSLGVEVIGVPYGDSAQTAAIGIEVLGDGGATAVGNPAGLGIEVLGNAGSGPVNNPSISSLGVEVVSQGSGPVNNPSISSFGVEVVSQGSGPANNPSATALGVEVIGVATVASSNNVRFGSTTIAKAYLGSQQLSKIRFGEQVIEL